MVLYENAFEKFLKLRPKFKVLKPNKNLLMLHWFKPASTVA